MDAIKKWLKAHSISSQSVAGAWIMATVLYNTNPDFAAYCGLMYRAIPKGLHSFLVGFVVPVAIFWKSTHSTTVSATVEDGSGQTATATAAAVAPTPKP